MRRPVAMLVAVVSLTTVVPAVAAPAPVLPATSAEDLQRLRDQLAAANGDLDALDAAIARATGELDDIDARLARATADLSAVEDELVDAEAAREQAVTDAATATDQLVEANAELDEARSLVARQEDAMSSRIRSMWKYGGADPGSLMLEGLARSETLHDASTTMRTVAGIMDGDHDMLVDAADATRAEARVRSRVAVAQKQARDAEVRAAAERDRVALLVDQQTALVTAVGQERANRAAVLEALAADRLATARLVSQLEAQVAETAAALASATRPIDPDARFDGPMPAWAAGLPSHGQPLAPAIAGAAASAGVDPRLFAALVWSESNFHPRAVSHAGAIGLSQLMPGTAAGLGVDPWDPIQNMVGGARFLRGQLDRFGTADLALAAYNAGPGRVERAGRRIPDITETQVYVLRVLERYEALADLG